jgi:hypothetical protein
MDIKQLRVKYMIAYNEHFQEHVRRLKPELRTKIREEKPSASESEIDAMVDDLVFALTCKGNEIALTDFDEFIVDLGSSIEKRQTKRSSLLRDGLLGLITTRLLFSLVGLMFFAAAIQLLQEGDAGAAIFGGGISLACFWFAYLRRLFIKL